MSEILDDLGYGANDLLNVSFVFIVEGKQDKSRLPLLLEKYNQVYLRDQFLMIRDGDGKDPEELASQLCRYYDERNQEDVDRLPEVTRRNVLILKYYSFENYFFNPAVWPAWESWKARMPSTSCILTAGKDLGIKGRQRRG